MAADGPSLAGWIMHVWSDLAVAGGLGAWFGAVAHGTRLRRGNSKRTSLKCLIVDCLIGSAAAEVALVACISANTSTPGTVLAVAMAGYLGQAALDKAAGRVVKPQEEPAEPDTPKPKRRTGGQ